MCWFNGAVERSRDYYPFHLHLSLASEGVWFRIGKTLNLCWCWAWYHEICRNEKILIRTWREWEWDRVPLSLHENFPGKEQKRIIFQIREWETRESFSGAANMHKNCLQNRGISNLLVSNAVSVRHTKAVLQRTHIKQGNGHERVITIPSVVEARASCRPGSSL